jgi:hypothetical protein
MMIVGELAAVNPQTAIIFVSSMVAMNVAASVTAVFPVYVWTLQFAISHHS